MIYSLSIGTLVTEGFSLALIVWVIVWGLSYPWRLITRMIGLRGDFADE